MRKIFLTFITLIFLFSLTKAKTIKADVTGDKWNDKVEMGLKSVVVTDLVSCCTRNKYTVVSDVEYLADIMVDDYHPGVPSNEIAVVTLPENDYLTRIYGLKNHKFVPVSDVLPGTPSFDEYGNLFGYYIQDWEGGELQVPCPIIEQAGFLKPATLEHDIEAVVVVDPGQTKEVKINVPKNTLAVVVATTQETDAIIFLLDEDETLITQRNINTEKPMTGMTYADKEKTISLVIDNLQSPTPKKVYYVVRHYTNAVMKGMYYGN